MSLFRHHASAASSSVNQSFIFKELPRDQIEINTISPSYHKFLDSLITDFQHLYRQGNHKRTLKVGHDLLYRTDIPLSIRFKFLWSVAAAHHSLHQSQVAISFLNEYLRCCDLLSSDWEEDGLAPEQIDSLKIKVKARIMEMEDEMLLFENSFMAAAMARSEAATTGNVNHHPDPSNCPCEQELQRYHVILEQQNRRIQDQDVRIRIQDDLLRRKDLRFAEQVELLHRSYDRTEEKEDQIRRLEAEAIIERNNREKAERAYIREKKFNDFMTSLSTPTRRMSISSLSPSDSSAPAAEASFFGIPLAQAQFTRRGDTVVVTSVHGPMRRCVTLPALQSDSHPPVVRLPRSLSTDAVPVGLPAVREMSPPLPSKKTLKTLKKEMSTMKEVFANLVAKFKLKRK